MEVAIFIAITLPVILFDDGLFGGELLVESGTFSA